MHSGNAISNTLNIDNDPPTKILFMVDEDIEDIGYKREDERFVTVWPNECIQTL
jgi:hypothetical protein